MLSITETLKVRITFFEEALGMSPADKEIYSKFIASKAPDALSREEEVEAIGADAVEVKEMTIFPRTKDGELFFWDYQIKGFLKDACGMLRKMSGSECSKVKAYKKEIDGLIFPHPRNIIIHLPEGEEIGNCQRPLRASTPQGERIALANSETIPAGSWFEVEFKMLNAKASKDMIIECLEYGELRGMAQWRNSGKGRFTYEIIEDEKAEKPAKASK